MALAGMRQDERVLLVLPRITRSSRVQGRTAHSTPQWAVLRLLNVARRLAWALIVVLKNPLSFHLTTSLNCKKVTLGGFKATFLGCIVSTRCLFYYHP